MALKQKTFYIPLYPLNINNKERRNMQILDNYNDVLTFKELKEILKIGKNKCYELLKQNQIPSIRIGNTYRIPKINVIRFLENQK